MFDLIFAVIIIVVSLSLLFSYSIETTSNINIYNLNRNILSGFTTIPINNLNAEDIRQMFIDSKIRNIENTVGQQVIEFYALGEDEYAKNLTDIFVRDYVDSQMNFLFTLENATDVLLNLSEIYNRPEMSYDNATIASAAQRHIFTFRNSTDFYGPYVLKIKIWK